MTPQQLANKLETVIIRANQVLADGITTVQDYLYNQVVKVLKDLELDTDGHVLQNSVNRKIIEKAIRVIDDKIRITSYRSDVENFLETINQIDKATVTYFSLISDSFKSNKQFVASLQRQTISQIEEQLFNSGFESQIVVPLRQILNQNINSGGQFTGLLDQVKTYIKGTELVDGKLLSYSKTITRDTLFNYSRAFQAAISNDLGLVWYCYSGGLMDKSRSFCVERAGHYYHEDEVKSWADLDWAGKAAGTSESSIFIYCGGYNCTHTLIPVLESVVPDDDMKSAQEGGFVE